MATAAVYRPRNPEENPLYGVVTGHLETFLVRQREQDRNVPGFVEKCGAPHFSTNVKLSVMWSWWVKALGIGLQEPFNSTLFGGYSDSNQSRIVRSLLQGVRDRLGIR